MDPVDVSNTRRWLKETPLYALAKPLIRWSWQLRGRPVPPPHAIKEMVLRDYARRFGTRVFVETGTYLGDMLAQLQNDFDEIYSIELSPSFWERAVKRFASNPRIHPLQGDSSDVLPRILEKLDRPALFWLDGHACWDIRAQGVLNTPIVREMELIFAHRIRNHVIVIDDARLFNGTDDYPVLGEFLDWIRSIRNDYVTEVAGDSIRLTPIQ
jgi:hypothetical protein